ncbi:leucine- glutamate- and lysine-rich 1 [Schistosoma japonicum]|uniref:Leucine-glutamate-and lysine-rich 1 n=1 Tax=Schistosoma japonicum TaxID=6182 RepID=A0A4Z2CYB4_SCHJA|nr:leucine- glutamate- and lysine-rich 1 [Schistosoma japonicum]
MAISEKDQQYDSSELVKDLRTYRPKYPLPEELQGICTEDTFCAYCGVSYLILNEIKFLENTADNLRKELDFFKRNQGLDSLVRVSHTDLSAYDDKETSECIKRLLQEKGEIIQQLDDAKTKLFCYEATEKQFVKEIAKSQATVSYTQEQLIELLDYLKKIRNKLRDGLFTDGQLRPIFDKINSLRGHISELNKIYNISLSQLNNQFNQLTGKVDSISLEKDSIVNKFNELELKYKEERNRWSEDRGQQLADILVLKTKLSEETKRCNNIHEEKRQLISNFEQTINHLKEENQSVLSENKILQEKIASLNEQLNAQLQEFHLYERNSKEQEQCLQKQIVDISEELARIKKLNNHLNTSLEMGKQEIFELKTLKDSQNDLCKQLQGKLQEMEKEFNVEQQNKKLTLEKEWKLSLEKKELEFQQYRIQTDQRIEQLTLEVEQKERENSVLHEEHRRIMGTMKEEINQLTNTVNNSNSIRTELENQVQKYQQEVKSILVFFCFIFQ